MAKTLDELLAVLTKEFQEFTEQKKSVEERAETEAQELMKIQTFPKLLLKDPKVAISIWKLYDGNRDQFVRMTCVLDILVHRKLIKLVE